MAQELFRNRETEARERKDRLVKRGLLLWRQYAEEYRVLPYKYFFYLVEKKKAKLKLNKIPSVHCDADEYPEIPFFRILNPDEALVWLEDMDVDTLQEEISNIQFIIDTNYLYKSMKEWVAEAIYLLSHKKPGAFSLAMGVSRERYAPVSKHTFALQSAE